MLDHGEVIGIDLAEEMVRQARPAPRRGLRQGAVAELLPGFALVLAQRAA